VKRQASKSRRRSAEVGAVRQDCERCTVVVPRTHRDGKYAVVLKRGSVGMKKRIGEDHFVKLGRDADVERRARALLLRPEMGKPLPYHSVLVLWNSRLLHQGHTIIRETQPKAPDNSKNAPFNPENLNPTLFHMDDPLWLGHLQREGYVVIRNVLQKTDVKKALDHLLEDIRSFSPSAKKASNLGQVCKADFPPMMNGTMVSLGMPHASFAWFVRCHPRIQKVFGMLFPRKTLTGSVDLLFISAPGTASDDRRATNVSHNQWLHVDQNERVECGDLPMYQGMLSVYSKDTLPWGRIAAPICMAPKNHREVGGINAEKSLLAMCIAGVASTHWPQLGIRHSQGRLTLGMVVHGVAKKFKQLPVRLHPDLPASRANEILKHSHAQLCRQYSLEELRSFVHPRALKFISTGVCPSTGKSI